MLSEAKKRVTLKNKNAYARLDKKNSKWIYNGVEKTVYAKSATTTSHSKVYYYYWLANPKCSPLQDFTELNKDALIKVCKDP